jgi:hypothetical protein
VHPPSAVDCDYDFALLALFRHMKGIMEGFREAGGELAWGLYYTLAADLSGLSKERKKNAWATERGSISLLFIHTVASQIQPSIIH